MSSGENLHEMEVGTAQSKTAVNAGAKAGDSMDTSIAGSYDCLLYTSPSPRDLSTSRMPSSA